MANALYVKEDGSGMEADNTTELADIMGCSVSDLVPVRGVAELKEYYKVWYVDIDATCEKLGWVNLDPGHHPAIIKRKD
jgi:hypothetical protein